MTAETPIAFYLTVPQMRVLKWLSKGAPGQIPLSTRTMLSLVRKGVLSTDGEGYALTELGRACATLMALLPVSDATPPVMTEPGASLRD